jgi:hypothetical protein
MENKSEVARILTQVAQEYMEKVIIKCSIVSATICYALDGSRLTP